ncbi:hypothetical protein ARMGADRAFT_753588 [Armillaria gallica]|uniref:Uncharacterized protein n=1 Tax=Armillaria gallica TaxID=47427 RepID=A0A2H3DPW3_ARMGA|nr:hypothetical protein ARMGADRAFT_753588 [Armillaria gallica]
MRMYTKLVASDWQSSMSPPGADSPINLFLPSLSETLIPLVTFLRLLLHSTHPAPPASPAILYTFKHSRMGMRICVERGITCVLADVKMASAGKGWAPCLQISSFDMRLLDYISS